jgi:hypothetical protein
MRQYSLVSIEIWIRSKEVKYTILLLENSCHESRREKEIKNKQVYFAVSQKECFIKR